MIERSLQKAEPTIFECLLDFVSVLESEEHFDQLKKQHFWDSLKYYSLYIKIILIQSKQLGYVFLYPPNIPGNDQERKNKVVQSI